MKNETIFFKLIFKSSSSITESISKIEVSLGTKLQNYEGRNLPEEYTFFTKLLGLKILLEILDPQNSEKRTYILTGQRLSKYHIPKSEIINISFFLKRIFTKNGFEVIYPKG